MTPNSLAEQHLPYIDVRSLETKAMSPDCERVIFWVLGGKSSSHINIDDPGHHQWQSYLSQIPLRVLLRWRDQHQQPSFLKHSTHILFQPCVDRRPEVIIFSKLRKIPCCASVRNRRAWSCTGNVVIPQESQLRNYIPFPPPKLSSFKTEMRNWEL